MTCPKDEFRLGINKSKECMPCGVSFFVSGNSEIIKRQYESKSFYQKAF